MSPDWLRVPGEGAYARVEQERRWRLAALPDGLADGRHVVDRYVDGTRLRLRRVSAGDRVVWKLGQKVRPDPADPSVVRVTSTYLDEAEAAVLSALPAAVVEKTRWRRGRLVVDVFAGRLAGLVLAEVEVEDLAADVPEVADLTGAVEVTADDRFSGGALARAAAPPVLGG